MCIRDSLNTMLKNVFCCDYLIIIKNCNDIDNMKIILYSNENLKDKLNYFINQDIYFTREKYEERWNKNKQKHSEFSTTIKCKINNIEISIGEIQFHKSSRKQIKFRFYNKFLEELFY